MVVVTVLVIVFESAERAVDILLDLFERIATGNRGARIDDCA